MKSFVKSFSAIFLIFLFSTIGFSQDTITIKLIVDTDNFDPDDMSASCSFEAVLPSGEVQRSTGNLEDFKIVATVEDTIIWEGQALDSLIIVDIKKIRRDSGKEIFNSRRLYGSQQGNSNKETVKSKVLYSTQSAENAEIHDEYKYSISFKINKGKTYKIDPKVRIVPPAN
jgi:hypothetical protein